MTTMPVEPCTDAERGSLRTPSRPSAPARTRATPSRRALTPLVLLALASATQQKLRAQALPTAVQDASVSAFALLGLTYTGLGGDFNHLGGRNLPLTVGADLYFVNTRRLNLAVEARGSYPLDGGEVDAQKSLLAGARASHTFAADHRNAFSPYVDLLAGRGSIEYVNGGYAVPPLVYTYTSGNVFSLGGGLDVRLTPALSFVAEAQFQRWPTPVTPAQRITAKQASAGLAYRFGSKAKARSGVP